MRGHIGHGFEANGAVEFIQRAEMQVPMRCLRGDGNELFGSRCECAGGSVLRGVFEQRDGSLVRLGTRKPSSLVRVASTRDSSVWSTGMSLRTCLRRIWTGSLAPRTMVARERRGPLGVVTKSPGGPPAVGVISGSQIWKMARLISGRGWLHQGHWRVEGAK